ncbi:MAG TPA: type II toxin-antitoxin system VapC family toxin [Spirochaetia bacterium]|nr:type II toxin-antitoxin system VapC family toxin [Spirochaetia bacterium]
MSTKPQLVYIETSMVIAFLKGEEGRVEESKAALFEAEKGHIRAITSALTIAEVVKVEGGVVIEESERLIDDFFVQPWLRVVMVDRRVATKARHIGRQFNLKPADAIHVATAVLYQAQYIYTYDDRILGLSAVLPTLCITYPRGQLYFNFPVD